ncbi:hypothetical protein F5051DRAFT_433525 [Lentinula edodes]|nr:hypothetical protein F5051DRAFT_433525 [Lentinula edodes]
MDKLSEILSSPGVKAEYKITITEPFSYGERLLLNPTLAKLFDIQCQNANVACKVKDHRWGSGWYGVTIRWEVSGKKKSLTLEQWKKGTLIFLPKQSLQHLYWTMNEKHREDYKDDGEDEDDHEEDSMEEEERGYHSDETWV